MSRRPQISWDREFWWARAPLGFDLAAWVWHGVYDLRGWINDRTWASTAHIGSQSLGGRVKRDTTNTEMAKTRMAEGLHRSFSIVQWLCEIVQDQHTPNCFPQQVSSRSQHFQNLVSGCSSSWQPPQPSPAQCS